MTRIIISIIYIAGFLLTYAYVVRIPKRIPSPEVVLKPNTVKMLCGCFFLWWLIALLLSVVWIWFRAVAIARRVF